MELNLNIHDTFLRFEPEYPFHAKTFYDFKIESPDMRGAMEIIVTAPEGELERVELLFDTFGHNKYFTENHLFLRKENSVFKGHFYTESPVQSVRLILPNRYLNDECKITLRHAMQRPSKFFGSAQFKSVQNSARFLVKHSNIAKKGNLKKIKQHLRSKNLKTSPIKPLEEHKTVDILMTTYNGSAYLHEQIDSLLSQSFSDFRLLICDDRSTDNSFEILEEYARKDDRILLFKNSKNLGHIQNFEKLMYLSNADYIFFCDQDDVWLKEKVARSLSTLKEAENGSGTSLVFSDLEVVNEKMEHIHPSFWEMMSLDIHSGKTNFLFDHGNFVTGCTICIPKEMLSLALPLNKQEVHDYQLARIATQHKGITPIHDALIRYRQHGKNATGTYSDFIEYLHKENGKFRTAERVRLHFPKETKTQHVDHTFIAQKPHLQFLITPSKRLCRIHNIQIHLNDRDITSCIKPENFKRIKEFYYARSQSPRFLMKASVQTGDEVRITFDIEYAWAEII